MTTGNRTTGSEPLAGFYSKQWNGANGKFSGTDLKYNPYTCRGRVITSSAKGKNFYLSITWQDASGVIPWTANDDIKLLGQLSNAARGHQFNLGVAIGEGRETFKLITSTVLRFHGAIRALRKGRIDLALRHLGAAPLPHHKGKRLHQSRVRELSSKDISNMWLEIQYGWHPLLKDVHESALAYSAIANKARKSRFTVTYTKRKDVTIVKPGNIKNGVYVGHCTGSKQIIAILNENLSAPRSLGLLDPRSVAWELTPFSFVADWFIPITTYLDDLSVIPSLRGTFIITSKFRNNATESGLDDTSQHGFKGASYNASITELTRTVSPSLVIPSPEFVPIEDVFSVGRMKNALALLHQQLF